MRRIVMTAVATISLAAPSAALAHHGQRHHHHRGHHRGQAHVLAFHAQAPASSTPTTGAAPSGSTPSGESAGTIVSFENGVLTVKLSDGSTVAGKVTEQTEIECAAPSGTSSSGQSGFDQRQHGDDANFGDGSQGGPQSGPQSGSWDDQGEGDDNHGGCPGHEENGQQTEHCTTAALVPGATVQDALLLVSGQGASWLKVEL